MVRRSLLTAARGSKRAPRKLAFPRSRPAREVALRLWGHTSPRLGERGTEMQDQRDITRGRPPHMTWTQMGGCSAVFRQMWGLARGQGGRTRYRPNMGVTSSMLFGLEYADGLRNGSGRSELVP
jgi:hypothetical protein